MAVLKVALLGDPVLRRVADEVTDPDSEETAALVRHLEDTLIESSANGIAAPQVGASQRIVLYRIAESRIPRGSDITPLPLRVLINPVLVPTTDKIIRTVERCMSVPHMQGLVPRFAQVHVEATDHCGRPLTIDAQGYHAVLLQHEIDHLNGVMFIDRMDDLTTLMFEVESRRDFRAGGMS